jgi:hypothetical protein
MEVEKTQRRGVDADADPAAAEDVRGHDLMLAQALRAALRNQAGERRAALGPASTHAVVCDRLRPVDVAVAAGQRAALIPEAAD